LKKLKTNKTFTKKNKKKIKNQKNNDQIEKHNIWQIRIKWWNSKQIKYLQKDQKQKLKIKRIWTEFEIPTIKMIKLSFFREERKETKEKKKPHKQQIDHSTSTSTTQKERRCGDTCNDTVK